MAALLFMFDAGSTAPQYRPANNTDAFAGSVNVADDESSNGVVTVASTSTSTMLYALLSLSPPFTLVPARAAAHLAADAGHVSSVLPTTTMLPRSFVVKRGVNARMTCACAPADD